jgi:hypothetical protein
MPQRPIFWIHRTRRFWLGLGVLVALVAGMIIIVNHTYELIYSANSVTANTWTTSSYIIGLQDGGIEFSRVVNHYDAGPFPSSIPTSGSHWGHRTSFGYEIRFLPSYRTIATSHGRTQQLFLPVTLFILIHIIIWSLWMHRIDKKEIAYYQSTEPTG